MHSATYKARCASWRCTRWRWMITFGVRMERRHIILFYDSICNCSYAVISSSLSTWWLAMREAEAAVFERSGCPHRVWDSCWCGSWWARWGPRSSAPGPWECPARWGCPFGGVSAGDRRVRLAGHSTYRLRPSAWMDARWMCRSVPRPGVSLLLHDWHCDRNHPRSLLCVADALEGHTQDVTIDAKYRRAQRH